MFLHIKLWNYSQFEISAPAGFVIPNPAPAGLENNKSGTALVQTEHKHISVITRVWDTGGFLTILKLHSAFPVSR